MTKKVGHYVFVPIFQTIQRRIDFFHSMQIPSIAAVTLHLNFLSSYNPFLRIYNSAANMSCL